jgi:hypothetical protein
MPGSSAHPPCLRRGPDAAAGCGRPCCLLEEARGPLTVHAIFLTALRIYRQYPLRVAILALVLFLPVELIERILDEHVALSSSTLGQVLLGSMPLLAAGGLSLLMEIMYAGLLDATAEAVLAGRPSPSIGSTLRHLPYVRLIAVSVLVGILAVLGFIAVIVPGLVVLTLCCQVGGVTVREQRSLIGTIAGSARLVRPRWRAAAAVLFLPALAAGTVEDVAGGIVGRGVVATLLLSALLHVSLLAVGGLMLAVLGDQLLQHGSDAGP